MTRLTDRHKTILYFKRVLVSSDTWGRSSIVQVAQNGRCPRSSLKFNNLSQTFVIRSL
ncbi:hypothetical protein BVI2075_580034 [Burkholderia vietnamiensis]|nr:hypothetical protein BVI1335_1220035 [Burkholderia vietnamiensis]CAG9214299.1 hypothetical protein BVI2075_580034 [Burkholderia vietnamiensis]